MPSVMFHSVPLIGMEKDGYWYSLYCAVQCNADRCRKVGGRVGHYYEKKLFYIPGKCRKSNVSFF